MSANLAPWPPVEPSQAEPSPHKSAQALSAALLATLWDGYAIPPGRVRVVVRAHQVQLLGEVDWKYQQQGASRCALALPGIHSVDNQLTLTPEPTWPGPMSDLANVARVARITRVTRVAQTTQQLTPARR
jgi:hypothetical protein